MESVFNKDFAYSILVKFPVDLDKWDKLQRIIHAKRLQHIYIFEVLSEDDCQQAEQLIEMFRIKNTKFILYIMVIISTFSRTMFLLIKKIFCLHIFL